MRIATSIVLSLLIAVPLIAHARPSFRSIKNEGEGQLQSAAKTKLQSMSAGMKQQYELREHPRGNGMSIMIPKDWKQYLPVKSRDLAKYFASDLAIYYLDHKDGMEMLGFGLNVLDHPATLDDANRLHEELAKQPTTDFELTNKGFLHDYGFIAVEDLTIAGMPARAHTYTFINASVHWQATDIRIPKGNTMIYLFYQAPKSMFGERQDIFRAFYNSLILSQTKAKKTPPKTSSAQIKKSVKKSSASSRGR